MANAIDSMISIEDKKRFDDFLFLKAIDSPIVQSFFNYICVFATTNPPDKQFRSALSIIGEFNLGPNLTQPMVQEFLKELDYTLFSSAQLHHLSPEDEAKKEAMKSGNYSEHNEVTEAIDRDEGKNSGRALLDPSSSEGNEKEVPVEFEPENARYIGRSKFLENDETIENQLTSSFLRHRYGTKPVEGYDLQSSLVT
jgi:hypothetical protein